MLVLAFRAETSLCVRPRRFLLHAYLPSSLTSLAPDQAVPRGLRDREHFPQPGAHLVARLLRLVEDADQLGEAMVYSVVARQSRRHACRAQLLDVSLSLVADAESRYRREVAARAVASQCEPRRVAADPRGLLRHPARCGQGVVGRGG